MGKAYFKEWVGKSYKPGGLMILSESAYSWRNAGALVDPSSNHPSISVRDNIERNDGARYFTLLNQALCGSHTPTPSEKSKIWERCLYTIYVQRSVGEGPRVRPLQSDWASAGEPFLNLLNKHRPSKLIVTGKTMWQKMPECQVRLLDNLQAYELTKGELVWCLALPHPARAFSPTRECESVKYFLNAEFPPKKIN